MCRMGGLNTVWIVASAIQACLRVCLPGARPASKSMFRPSMRGRVYLVLKGPPTWRREECEPVILNSTGKLTNPWELVRRNENRGDQNHKWPPNPGQVLALRAHCSETPPMPPLYNVQAQAQVQVHSYNCKRKVHQTIVKLHPNLDAYHYNTA